MRHSRHCQSGFTLVEMSIVLIIIGLLVGGVMAAQSYIKNAQMRTLITEGKYYIDALTQFQERYHALPGDMATASEVWPTANGIPAAGNGDGNGLIRAGRTPKAIETFLVFQHLSLAGFIEGSYTGTGTDAVVGTNIPLSSTSGNAVPVGLYFDHTEATDGVVPGNSNDSGYYDGMYLHVLRIAAMTPGAGGLPAEPFLTPEQTMALDIKFDDGKPGSGWLTTLKSPDCANSATEYHTTNIDNGCSLILRAQ